MVARWSWVRAGALVLGIGALAGGIVALFATKNSPGTGLLITLGVVLLLGQPWLTREYQAAAASLTQALQQLHGRTGCSAAVPVPAVSGVTLVALPSERMTDGIPQPSDLGETNRLAGCSQGVVRRKHDRNDP
jgi:hypothetical protein